MVLYPYAEGDRTVIVFDKLWITMEDRGISQYKLLKEYEFSSGQLDRLRKNGNVSTYTLSQLCICNLLSPELYHYSTV